MASPSPTWEWKPYTRTIHRSVYPAISPTNPSNSAAGKVVLVTGGGSGLGKHIAAAFNQAGAKAVIITGRREKALREAAAELEKSGDARVLWFVADVTDEVALTRAFASAAEAVGPIDVVVANAGYMATPAPAASADLGDWWKAYGSFSRLLPIQPHSLAEIQSTNNSSKQRSTSKAPSSPFALGSPPPTPPTPQPSSPSTQPPPTSASSRISAPTRPPKWPAAT
jgi:hypothetical protein